MIVTKVSKMMIYTTFGTFIEATESYFGRILIE